jgi:hypothetical protein
VATATVLPLIRELYGFVNDATKRSRSPDSPTSYRSVS